MTRHLPGDPDCWRTCTHEATPPPAVARLLDAHLLDIADRRRDTVATDPFPRSLPTNPDGSLRALRSDPPPRGLYRDRPIPVVHRSPRGDSAVTPCCGRAPFELPTTDHLTIHPSLVTCTDPCTGEAPPRGLRPLWRRLWDTRGHWGFFALLYPTVAAGVAVLLARRLTRGR